MIKTVALGVFVSCLAASDAAHGQTMSDMRKAAENGNRNAEFSLALRYKSGRGLPENLTAGFCWMHRSAEHGHPGAWFSVGLMYAMGEGVRRDNVEAYKWLTLEAEHSPPGWSEEFQNDAVKDIAVLEKHMTSDQVRDAKTRASRWWQTVVARGPIKDRNQQYVRFPGDRPPC